MDTIQQQLLRALEEKAATVAQEDINFFCEYVMRDEKGNAFVQFPLHKIWHGFINLCESHRISPVILAPWGSGKSQQIAIARVLWEIGRNPSIRIKLVCNSDDNAKLRVASIGRYIKDSKEYHAVFPEVVPDRDAFWSAHALFVKRKGQSVDPTVDAKGILSTGIGGRADLIVFDDIVDMRNAIEQPALRQKVKDSFSNVWMSRLDVDGRAWYIATAWHHDDLTSLLRFDKSKRQRYWILTQAVTDNLQDLRLMLDVGDGYEGAAKNSVIQAAGKHIVGVG
jgi:hypothetical protein